MFVVFDVLLVVLAILFLIFVFKLIEKLLFKFRNAKPEELKKVKRKVKITFAYIILLTNIMVIIILMYFLLKYNNSFIFIRNLNTVANNYYKEVDKNELLESAFESVLNELDDPYAEILQEKDMDFFYNKDDTFGYGLNSKNDGVYISSVIEELNDQGTIKDGDKIISVNGVDVSR